MARSSHLSKRGLGRGLDTLISQDFDRSLLLTAEDKVEKIPIDSLTPNPYQPRSVFDETALNELAESIKRHGIIQPLVITPLKDNKYALVAGERRWRAAKIANLETVPAIIRERKELEQLEIALIENVQREDLSPLEQAVSIERLHQQFNTPYDEIAKRLGKATSTIHNTIRLLNLPDAARKALIDNKISEGHARAILAIKSDPERQDYLLKSIIKHGWSVRQAERFVLSVKAGTKETKKIHEHVATETKETRVLSKKLKTPVHIRRSARGGRLEIEFRNDQELDRLINLF